VIKKVKKEMKNLDAQLKELDKKLNRIGNLRLIAAVVFIIGLVMGFKNGNPVGWLLAAVALLGFVYLVRQDGKTDDKIKYIEARKKVLNRYENRLKEQWREFEDDGKEFLSSEFTQGIDLDIFGKNSLFQYINLAHTTHGRIALANALKGKYLPQADIRNDAVAEMIENINFAWELESASELATKGRVGKTAYMENFLRIIKEQKIADGSMKLLAYGMPVVTFVAIVGALDGIIGFAPAFVLVALQLMLNMAASAAVKEKLDLLYEMAKPLKAYSDLSAIILEKNFNSSYLKEQQDRLKQGGSAKVGLQSLSGIVAMLEAQNSLLYLPLCGLLMWNYQCLLKFTHWCDTYKNYAEDWFQAVGEVESLISLANIGYIRDCYCRPEITQSEEPYIKGENMQHPLISEQKVVGNSFAQQGGLCVITGSNMSGKTTFMRTIGLNLVLAYAGGVVCAQSFEAPKMRLYTSMRIVDDVSHGISTFYGELLRIKEMVQAGEKMYPMIALIDEIFKGTNSADRIIGAKATLKSLQKPWIFTMVTTHDFELCDLANEVEKGSNYHFAEYYENEKLKFDYLIKDDRCKTSNAKALMKMVGLQVE